MIDELLNSLNPETRKVIYQIRLGLGVLLGASSVGFMTATGEIPLWLGVTTAVALFLGVPTDRMASTHVPEDPEDLYDTEDEPEDPVTVEPPQA